MPSELQVPALPWHLEYLWGYFQELNKRWRPSGGMGPSPLNEDLIDRWERRKGFQLKNWEAKAILAADDRYMEFQAKASEIRSKSGGG